MSKSNSVYSSGSGKEREFSNSSSTSSSGSKISMPKFLQKNGRDRTTSTSTAVNSAGVAVVKSDSRKLLGKRRESAVPVQPIPIIQSESPEDEEPPTIIEPQSQSPSSSPTTRPRSRSERIPSVSPILSTSQSPTDAILSSSSTSRIMSDIPNRLSGWFAHTFSASATDLSLPALLSHSSASSQMSQSPKRGSSGAALLAAAKHGKGQFDKAMRYLLDSDSTPDRSTEVIWLLGTLHPGYEPPVVLQQEDTGRRKGLRSSSATRPTSSKGGSTDTLASTLSQSAVGWPMAFYQHFMSSIWLTYRNQFIPLKDVPFSQLDLEVQDGQLHSTESISSSPAKRWNWIGSGDKGWTSDSGWGCMLRTGQSVLANALIHLHLGRDWRRPIVPESTNDYATYVRILTWFLDTPSPLAPFSVHRMAIAGKELGTEVGQWFGPSVAAGALKKLVNSYPNAGIGVVVGSDASIYRSDIYSSSYTYTPKGTPSSWGDRGVLVLIGTRLGIDGVNPIYYDTIKALYTFPQSVGIAGGRPSSSYYFLGTQGDHLFYLDPHHTRPAIPLRTSSSESRQEGTESPVSNLSPISPQSAPAKLPTAHTLHHHQHNSTSTTSSSSMSGSSHLSATSDVHRDFYAHAYTSAELRTFHCDKVRKMHVSGLDPSMLIGFLIQDESDWIDFRRRISALPKPIIHIAEERPNYNDSEEYGMESILEPDDLNMDEEELDGEEEVQVPSSPSNGSQTRSPSISPTASVKGGARSSDISTEEDALAPITPGPSDRHFRIPKSESSAKKSSSEIVTGDFEEEEGEWVDSVQAPRHTASQDSFSSQENHAAHSSDSRPSRRTRRSKKTAEEHFPFPQSTPSPDFVDELWDHGIEKRMNKGRGRDGGRTESGGVKGILTTAEDE